MTAPKSILDLLDYFRSLQDKPKEMQTIMREQNLKIDNLDNPMQKLAFTFYTELVMIAESSRMFFEEG